MKLQHHGKQIGILVAAFVVTRMLAMAFGLHMNPDVLNAYWQYLDVETLKNNVMAGIWYDHAQPPLFNLFLSLILKVGGQYSNLLFSLFLKGISLGNTLLLFLVIRKISPFRYLAFAVAFVYMLSPATLIFECELFYTSTVSFFLLLSVYFMIRFAQTGRRGSALGIILPLVLLCLTRSVYHIVWFALAVILILYVFRSNPVFRWLRAASGVGILVVGSWYLKNEFIFGQFTSSSWMGMNLARNVFHDQQVRDSGRIEAYEPFSSIAAYQKFLDPQFERAYQGLNDRDLLGVMKNDRFINENHVGYIRIARLYQQASLRQIRAHPMEYIKNVIQSSILYFTPATVYSLTAPLEVKIWPYDVLYSFNLTPFAKGKQERRVLLTISALPKMVLYGYALFLFLRPVTRRKLSLPWNLFILLTIAWAFAASSLFEHYENMRFRFETEPLFLIFAAQVFAEIPNRWRRGILFFRNIHVTENESASR